jgi:hypothetical protein
MDLRRVTPRSALVFLRMMVVVTLVLFLSRVIASQSATPEVTSETEPTTTDSPALLEALASARFEPVNPRPLTGQAFTIDFVISLPRGLELVEVPQFRDPWGEFELRSVSPLESESQADGSTLFRQQLEVVLWQPRDFVTPETFVGYRQTGFGDIQRLPVTPANITVPTVLDFEDLTLRPYKPLVYLPYISPWMILGGVALSIAVLVFIRRRWQQRPRPAAATTPPLTPGEIAWWRLDQLSSTNTDPQLRIPEAENALRRYLEARFGIPLQERAATVNALQGHLPHTILKALDDLLMQADLIKFSGDAAMRSTGAAHTADYVQRCQQWLRVVENLP